MMQLRRLGIRMHDDNASGRCQPTRHNLNGFSTVVSPVFCVYPRSLRLLLESSLVFRASNTIGCSWGFARNWGRQEKTSATRRTGSFNDVLWGF